jgi:hypothetical protein
MSPMSRLSDDDLISGVIKGSRQQISIQTQVLTSVT